MKKPLTPIRTIRAPKFKLSQLSSIREANQALMLLSNVYSKAELNRIVCNAYCFGITHFFLRGDMADTLNALEGSQQIQTILEEIRFYKLDSFLPLIKPLKEHFLAISITGHSGQNFHTLKKPVRAPGKPNAYFVGLSEHKDDSRLIAQCDHSLKVKTLADTIALPIETQIGIVLHQFQIGDSTATKSQTGFRAKMKQKKLDKKQSS